MPFEHNIYCPKSGEDLGECMRGWGECPSKSPVARDHADSTPCSECLGEEEDGIEDH